MLKVGVSPLSGSVAVTVMTPVWFSAAFTALPLVMLGASLVLLTVIVKPCVSVRLPSLTSSTTL